jgi:hypothetical protein
MILHETLILWSVFASALCGPTVQSDKECALVSDWHPLNGECATVDLQDFAEYQNAFAALADGSLQAVR